jgi:L-alanine-DL-glutamate epimerase-like enolase superfamily enzyme
MSAVIADVRTRVLADPHNPQLIVTVTAEDGLVGHGECWWGAYRPDLPPGAPVAPIATLVDELLAPLCVGHDGGRIERLWHELWKATYDYGDEGVVRIALSGIDLALWDLLGKRLGAPVARLLGGPYHDRVPAYASFTWLGDEDQVLTEAHRAVDSGFRAVKLHETDPDLARAVRAEFGDELAVMVDANGAFDVLTAARVAERLAEVPVTWFEEPTGPARDHERLARLRERTDVPLAAGENEFSVGGFERLLDATVIEYLQPEIAKIGGLTTARRISVLAERRGVALCPHNYSLGPSFFASLQWALSARHSRWLEVPWLPEGQRFPSHIAVPPVVDGAVTLPPAPGLGTPPLNGI